MWGNRQGLVIGTCLLPAVLYPLCWALRHTDGRHMSWSLRGFPSVEMTCREPQYRRPVAVGGVYSVWVWLWGWFSKDHLKLQLNWALKNEWKSTRLKKKKKEAGHSRRRRKQVQRRSAWATGTGEGCAEVSWGSRQVLECRARGLGLGPVWPRKVHSQLCAARGGLCTQGRG